MTDVLERAAEAIHEALGRDDFGSANEDERQEVLDIARALADKGLLLTGRTEWALTTETGAIIPCSERTALNGAARGHGTAQSRTFFTAPDPTPWRDV